MPLPFSLSHLQVNHYAPEREKIAIADEISPDIGKQLSDNQKAFLREFADTLTSIDTEDDQAFQNKIFTLGTKVHQLTARRTFQAVYLALIGKPYGPRLAPFIQILDKKWVIDRLHTAVNAP